MAFKSTGKDIALRRNDTNGKFTFDWATSGPNKGNPNFDDSRANAVLVTLNSYKRDPVAGTGGYYWDPSGLRGTFLYKVKQDRLATKGQLQAAADDGGQQLISKLVIQTFTSTAERKAPGKWTLTVEWSVPAGQYKQTVNL